MGIRKFIITFFSLILLLYQANAIAENAYKIITINYSKILMEAPDLSPAALRYSIMAYQWAKINHLVVNLQVITIIDFTLPANQKRLWVIDLTTNSVLIHTYASHGANSGELRTLAFSNQMNSHESSFGVFKTLNTYMGKRGYSLRIAGLEPGINNNVYKRNIVIHPANYATYHHIKEYNQLGRTFGCIGIDPAISLALINDIKDGTLLIAYPGKYYKDNFLMNIGHTKNLNCHYKELATK